MAAAQDEGEGKLEQQQGAATGRHGTQACQRIRVATLATGPMRAIGGVQANSPENGQGDSNTEHVSFLECAVERMARG